MEAFTDAVFGVPTVTDILRELVSEAGSRHIYDHPFFGLFQPFFPLVFALDRQRLPGSLVTPRWRKTDSNLRPTREESGVQRFLAASSRSQRNAAGATGLEDFGRVSIGG
jgi:hypothetical protein